MKEHDNASGDAHQIVCHLDELLAHRQMTLTALAEQVGLTVVNLSILKNDRAKAVRFSTLTRICDVLNCQPGDVLSMAQPPTTADHGARKSQAPKRSRFLHQQQAMLTVSRAKAQPANDNV